MVPLPIMETDLFSDLEWRGLVHQCTDPELGKKLAAEQMTVYCGFDPSADSLHHGSLLQLLALLRFQRAGHRPIAVAGGGTGLIGDPSGKATERPLLAKEEVEANVAGIRRQLERFLDFGRGRSQALLVNNADWLCALNLTDFLRDVGKHFTVNMMIAKESVRARLEDREQGISFTEFSFMLLQAYDFLHLFDHYGCRLQIGGSDQWGNITAGIELIRRVRGEEAYGLTCPLIERLGGGKFGKTEEGTVWLDPARTSPYDFYQYWINTDDRDVARFLKFFTFCDRERIAELEERAGRDPAKREAQRALAFEVTALVHGVPEAEKAVRASEALFSREIAGLDEATLLQVLADSPSTDSPRSGLEGEGVPLVDLLVSTGLAASRSAARADIEGGGVYVNNLREEAVDRKLAADSLLLGRYLLLRRGKKTHHLVRFV